MTFLRPAAILLARLPSNMKLAPIASPAPALLLVLLALWVCPAPLAARSMPVPLGMEYQVDAWEVEDGLPENSATAMVQTRDGYLWFGTFGGLVRFNGLDFKVYDRFAIPGLTNSGIITLDIDTNQRLWASTYQGMAMRRQGEWKLFTAAEGWVGRFSRSFAVAPDGNPWFTTSEGRVLRYDGHRFQQLPPVDEDGFPCL